MLSLLKGRKLKGPKPFTFAERVKMAMDTATGMAHLTESKFVHRDLAARNVLVDALNTCKVADFGLARGIAGARAGPDTNEDGEEEEYYRSRTGTFPVRWTAPEAMQTMRFSEATDVWSFGITMIEVFTDGGKPYAGMANAAVISKVQGGYRVEKPTLCNDEMYAILLKCWSAKQTDRPTFKELMTMLNEIPTEDGSGNSDGGTAAATNNAASDSTLPGRSTIVVNATYATSDSAAVALPAAAAVAETVLDEEYLNVLSGVEQHAAASSPADDGGGDNDDDDEYLTVAQTRASVSETSFDGSAGGGGAVVVDHDDNDEDDAYLTVNTQQQQLTAVVEDESDSDDAYLTVNTQQDDGDGDDDFEC